MCYRIHQEKQCLATRCFAFRSQNPYMRRVLLLLASSSSGGFITFVMPHEFNMPHPSTAAAYGQATFVAIITLLVFGWTTVALRLWVRLRITKSAGWDDATMVLTLFLFTSYSAFISVIVVRADELNLLTEPAAILQTLLVRSTTLYA
jgi:hypothetical protein